MACASISKLECGFRGLARVVSPDRVAESWGGEAGSNRKLGVGAPAHYLVVLSPHLKSLSRGLRRLLLVNAEGETVGVEALIARAPESPVFRKCDVSAIFTDLSSVTECPHQSEFRVASAIGTSRLFVPCS